MSKETAKLLIKRAFELTDSTVCFTFQGGEPCLAGLDFYRYFVETAKALNGGKRKLHWSIQTNGTLIDGAWAQFLKENDFLVGISVDGPREVHDKHRGKGSYDKALKGLETLKNAGINPNVLCVVTDDTDAKKCYTLYKSLGLKTMQFIPCLEKLGSSDYPLTPEHFGRELCTLYDAWAADIRSGKDISVRYFENLALMLSGKAPESCNFCGGCKLQFVTEADGDVYPCDFYCMDQWELGNIKETSYEEMGCSEKAINFAQPRGIADYDDLCKSCNFFKLCRGGCRREFAGCTHTRFCDAYRMLFDHIKSLSNV